MIELVSFVGIPYMLIHVWIKIMMKWNICLKWKVYTIRKFIYIIVELFVHLSVSHDWSVDSIETIGQHNSFDRPPTSHKSDTGNVSTLPTPITTTELPATISWYFADYDVIRLDFTLWLFVMIYFAMLCFPNKVLIS